MGLRKLGFEKNMVEIDYGDFENIKIPLGEKLVCHDLNMGNPRLKKSAKAVDAGKLIPNVNDDFTGRGPDIGAFKTGRPLPHYGPRPKKN